MLLLVMISDVVEGKGSALCRSPSLAQIKTHSMQLFHVLYFILAKELISRDLQTDGFLTNFDDDQMQKGFELEVASTGQEMQFLDISRYELEDDDDETNFDDFVDDVEDGDFEEDGENELDFDENTVARGPSFQASNSYRAAGRLAPASSPNAVTVPIVVTQASGVTLNSAATELRYNRKGADKGLLVVEGKQNQASKSRSNFLPLALTDPELAAKEKKIKAVIQGVDFHSKKDKAYFMKQAAVLARQEKPAPGTITANQADFLNDVKLVQKNHHLKKPLKELKAYQNLPLQERPPGFQNVQNRKVNLNIINAAPVVGVADTNMIAPDGEADTRIIPRYDDDDLDE